MEIDPFFSHFNFEGPTSCFNVFFNGKLLLDNCKSFSYINDLVIVINSGILIYVYEITNSKDIFSLSLVSSFIPYTSFNDRRFKVKEFIVLVSNEGFAKKLNYIS